MEASRLTIECRAFGDLNDVIRAACGARDASWTSPQFEYIQSYLQRRTARAKTMVVEKPYVDRHYLEEYGAYYFSAFRNGGPTTTRIHFFDIEFDRNKLSEWMQAAASGDAEKRDKIQGDLDDAYIGFMTVRPIPSAPIGRTILRPYKDKPTRSYIPAEGGHPVRSPRLPQAPCDARRDPRRKLASDRVQVGSISPERSMNHPGFYSVVRFCPDIERGEAVNVGVIVGASGLGMRVRMAERNEYVKRRLGAEAFDNTRLTLIKEGFAERLKEVEPRAEALAAFGAAEAGKLQISAPPPDGRQGAGR